MAILFKQLKQQPSYINKTSSMWPIWSTLLQRLGSSPDQLCDSTLLYQCSLKPSQMPAYCIAHWKSFTRWQHFKEGQAHSESFVKKAKHFRFCIFMRTETQSTVKVEVWGEFMLRNRQPKPSLSMHGISYSDQIQTNHQEKKKRKIRLWKALQIQLQTTQNEESSI